MIKKEHKMSVYGRIENKGQNPMSAISPAFEAICSDQFYCKEKEHGNNIQKYRIRKESDRIVSVEFLINKR